jgi:hypothetical protein
MERILVSGIDVDEKRWRREEEILRKATTKTQLAVSQRAGATQAASQHVPVLMSHR